MSRTAGTLPLFGMVVAVLTLVAAAGDRPAGVKSAASVDDALLAKPDGEPGNWITYNGSWMEQRFSPLDQIDVSNVSELRLVWSFSTDSSRGLEATPLVVDGVMYTTAPWSVVFAVDAKTGKQIWSYDPKVDKQCGAEGLLRRRQPRRRRLEGQGLRRRARRPADRARRRHRARSSGK